MLVGSVEVNMKVETSNVVGSLVQLVRFLSASAFSSASLEFGYTEAAIQRPYRFEMCQPLSRRLPLLSSYSCGHFSCGCAGAGTAMADFRYGTCLLSKFCG